MTSKRPVFNQVGVALCFLALFMASWAPLPAVAQLPTSQEMSKIDEQFQVDIILERSAIKVRGLRETGPASWDLMQSEDGKTWRQEGWFTGLLELEVPQPTGALAERGQAYDDFRLTILLGEHVDRDGTMKFVSGLMIDFGSSFADQSGGEMKAFVPVDSSYDYDVVLKSAHELASVMRDAAEGRIVVEEAPFGDRGGCKHACAKDFDRDMEWCAEEESDCRDDCLIETLVCLGICAITGSNPVCIAACIAYEILCLRGCARDMSCERQASQRYLDCIRDTCHP